MELVEMEVIQLIMDIYCKYLNCVEIEENNYNIIKNNINIFNLTNINLINGIYIYIYNILEQDIIVLDPPWGGPNYYKTIQYKIIFE